MHMHTAGRPKVDPVNLPVGSERSGMHMHMHVFWRSDILVWQLHIMISNCPNFSATALKRLIDTRCLCMNGHVLIDELRLYGDVPQLLPNDLWWFESWVPQFSCCRFRRDDIEL